LSITEEECDWFIFDTANHKNLLNVLPPSSHGIVLDNLNLKQFIVGNKSGHLSQRLPTTTAYSEEQRITGGLPDNPSYSGNMLGSVDKHDQLHGLATSIDNKGSIRVVIILIRIHSVDKHCQVCNLRVQLVLTVPTLHKIAENYSFGVENLFSTLAKLRESLFEHMFDLSSIIFGCQSVMEYSHIFMIPKFNHWNNIWCSFRWCAANSLEHLPNVAQVESIMGFRRSRKHVSFHLLEEIQNGCNNCLKHVFNGLRESSEKRGHQSLEDFSDNRSW
jgi:hypothetical protein